MNPDHDQMADHEQWISGWYYDPLHQQPVYVFRHDARWWGRFIWQEAPADTGHMQGTAISVQDIVVTSDMHHRLVRLSHREDADYIARGGCAIHDVYGIRALVQVKVSGDGHGVYIQAPASQTYTQIDPGCTAVWLADDEIPTVIRALQARRRDVLDSGTATDGTGDEA